MRFCRLINFFVLLSLVPGLSLAQEIHVILKLAEIRLEETATHGNESLYFSVTQYSSLGSSQENRVPQKPVHWLSQQLVGIKNVVLWTGSLQEGEKVRLILSLVDQERIPWEVGQSLGSLQLNLRNHHGHLRKQWSVPTFEKAQAIEMLKPAGKQRFLLKGVDAQYEVTFLVERK